MGNSQRIEPRTQQEVQELHESFEKFQELARRSADMNRQHMENWNGRILSYTDSDSTILGRVQTTSFTRGIATGITASVSQNGVGAPFPTRSRSVIIPDSNIIHSEEAHINFLVAIETQHEEEVAKAEARPKSQEHTIPDRVERRRKQKFEKKNNSQSNLHRLNTKVKCRTKSIRRY
mgnify:FL=1